MTFRWWWFIGSLLAVISLLWWNGSSRRHHLTDHSQSERFVRVWLPSNADSFTVSSSSGPLQLKSKGHEQLTNFATPSIEITIQDGSAVLFGGKQKTPLVFQTSSQLITFNGREYQGSLHLIIKNNEPRWILHAPLEAYVARVVEGEMSSHWPTEALNAQAILARSYALFHVRRHRRRSYDLLGDSRSQAFSSNWPSRSSEQAAINTANMILTQNKKALLTYYHSTCGGATKAFQQESMVFNSVQCSYCTTSPHYHWKKKISVEVLRTLLSKGLSSDQRLKKVTCLKEESGHVKHVIFSPEQGSSLQINGNTFRKHINKTYKKEVIKSLNFSLKLDDEHNLMITGHGWGYHGIGLCQYGSKKMAELKFSHQDILKHYYPQAVLQPSKP